MEGTERRHLIVLLLLMSVVFVYVITTFRTRPSQLQLTESFPSRDIKERIQQPLQSTPVPNLHISDQDANSAITKVLFWKEKVDAAFTSPSHHLYPEGECKPKTNIVFIKTVKTGGSTLTNILSRFAVKHDLTLFGNEFCEHPTLLHKTCSIHKEINITWSLIQKPAIISEHIYNNRKVLYDIMPNDVIYVTQLRHPLTQLISLLNFRGYSNVSDPSEVYRNWTRDFKLSQWNSWRQLCIAQDLTTEQFKSYVKQLTQEFDLVTITEQFDLSLLLLRRKLCWDITDMFYIPMKKADYKSNNNTNALNMTHSEIIDKKYENLNPNAYSMYRFFNKTLSDLVVEAGPDLQEELMWFRDQKQRLFNYCSEYIELIAQNSLSFLDVVNTSDVLNIPSSKWGRAKIFDPVECAMLKLSKKTFQRISVVKQVPLNQSISFLKNSEKIKVFYQLLHQPVHPKYGIPLPVLKDMGAYDLDEDIVHRGMKWQHRINITTQKIQEKVQLIDRCVAENHGTQ